MIFDGDVGSDGGWDSSSSVVVVVVDLDLDDSYIIFSMFNIELLNSLILRFDDLFDGDVDDDVECDGDVSLSIWKQIFS